MAIYITYTRSTLETICTHTGLLFRHWIGFLLYSIGLDYAALEFALWETKQPASLACIEYYLVLVLYVVDDSSCLIKVSSPQINITTPLPVIRN